MNIKTAFKPIVDENSKVLILGTMPGESSIRLQQYYGHAGNQFWKIMFGVFNESLRNDYNNKKQLLLTNKIALWDVLSHCEGKGSLDANIKNEVPNDFATFYSSYPNIKHVFLTSKKAEEFYDKYIGKKPGRSYYLLPSPSRANTWKTFEQKTEEWKIILQYLK
jgi:hypoxanthine-DNA glycosylase